MALTFSEKVRCSLGHRAFRAYEITADGTTTTIDATDLDLTTINCAILTPKADLTASVAFDGSELADAAGETTSIAVTGVVVGDQVLVSASVDLADLSVSGYAQAAGKIDVRFQNESTGTVNLAATTLRGRVIKHCGLTTQSGTYIRFQPALQSGDVIVVWAIGTGQ